MAGDVPRLAIVITSLGAGGAEKQAVLLANRLCEHASVSVVTMLDDPFRRPDLDHRVHVSQLGLQAHEIGVGSLGWGFLRARRVLTQLDPEVVISINFPAHLLVWNLQVGGLRARHVVSERNQYLGSKIRVGLRRRFYRFNWRTVVNSSATKAKLESYGLTHAPISVVYNAVNMPNPRRAVEGVHDPFRWVAVGSLTTQKDYPTMLRAFARAHAAKAARDDFTLDIFGSGELRKPLEGLVLQLGLSERVRFLGLSTNVVERLAEYDGMVLSSAWEGLPNVVLEAGSMGLPVVATDVGGVSEAIAPEALPLLAGRRNAIDLACQMQALMAMDQAERAKLSHAMSAYVARRFDPELVMSAWENVLQVPTSSSTTIAADL